ncbi:hypothetical protein C8R43DRAFT_414600 [Mycena crocata]|nr:hypothetical protein C8R43DRAFT_414600 [Mycena crocata]
MSDAALEADRARLKAVEAEILQLEHSLTSLRMEKQSIQARLDDLKYPVLTLPNEITSEIFLHFIPPYPKCPPPTGLLSPTLLTHICRKWRQISLSTPSLWGAIWLDSDLQPNFDSRKQILESWLVLSCSCPIAIKIFDDSDSRKDIFEVVIPHRLRWEYLQVHGDGELDPIIGGPTPLLRELDFYFNGLPFSPVSFKEAPLLRTVALNDKAAANTILPWAKLTSLTLHNVYPKECTPILLQTYSLVHCELNLFGEYTAHIQPDVNLPRLESLILGWKDNRVREYLGTFMVPALRKLEVAEMFLEPDHLPVLAAFSSKSGCNLQEVLITGERRTPKALYRKAFPLVPIFPFEDTTVETDDEDDEDD